MRVCAFYYTVFIVLVDLLIPQSQCLSIPKERFVSLSNTTFLTMATQATNTVISSSCGSVLFTNTSSSTISRTVNIPSGDCTVPTLWSNGPRPSSFTSALQPTESGFIGLDDETGLIQIDETSFATVDITASQITTIVPTSASTISTPVQMAATSGCSLGSFPPVLTRGAIYNLLPVVGDVGKVTLSQNIVGSGSETQSISTTYMNYGESIAFPARQHFGASGGFVGLVFTVTDPQTLQYRMFFRVVGHTILFEATSTLESDVPAKGLWVYTRLIGEETDIAEVGSTATLFDNLYLYGDAATDSSDILAVDVSTRAKDLRVNAPFQYRIRVAPNCDSTWSVATGYIKHVSSDGFFVIAQGKYIAKAQPFVDEVKSSVPDACITNSGAGPCNVTGGHTCITDANTGKATCNCPVGQFARPFGCYDIDECAEGTHACVAPASHCQNRDNGYDCGCDSGYSSQTGLAPCNPLDACAWSTALCRPPLQCSSVQGVGGYTCVCNSPFTELISGLCTASASSTLNIALNGSSYTVSDAMGPTSLVIANQQSVFPTALACSSLTKCPFVEIYGNGQHINTATLTSGQGVFAFTGTIATVVFRGLFLSGSPAIGSVLFTTATPIETILFVDCVFPSSLDAQTGLISATAAAWTSNTTTIPAA